MKKGLLLIALVCLTASVSFSQGISVGLRGGLTLTSGNTTFPANASQGRPVEFKNESDGLGTGFTIGGMARINFAGLFLQGELNYAQFKLKQKNNQTYTVTPASLTNNIKSESTLSAFNIPILVGTKLGPLRAYIGPSFLFVTNAEQKNTGEVVTSVGGVAINTTSVSSTQDLLTSEAGDFEVKPLIIAVEAGVGIGLPFGLEADLRYAIPAITGVYKNSDVKGFLGILSLSVGYRLAKLGL
ncbi:outer membrane beta-barrel protein [uncultured Microscilla sp.]|uniref:outer membrane beta-barrel protein n=1 Tax=uncultured Microscilla sp. TaxID=432653 RepID=UPI0026080C4D|nr:outer membrane beta-barrel protein [uncultured Microscilla sp.]